MSAFLGHRFVRELLSLGLPPDQFVIAGSGALFARGIIDEIGDLDVVARGPAWDRAAEIAAPRPAPRFGVRVIHLFGGDLEVLDGWFPHLWSIDELIDGAELIGGIRCAPIAVVRQSKILLGRPQDHRHLEALDAAHP